MAKVRTLYITVSDKSEVVKEYATELNADDHPKCFHVEWEQQGQMIVVTVRDEDDGEVG